MSAQLKEDTSFEKNLIYALDIGTRSVIGMIGQMDGSSLHIVAVEKLPHESRAMVDGQIEDIEQVSRTVKELTRRLEKKLGQPLQQVCVAAAGRSLRTEQGYSILELSAPEQIGEERVQQLTAQAVADAEHQLQQTENPDQRMFLVGYTATQFLLPELPVPTWAASLCPLTPVPSLKVLSCRFHPPAAPQQSAQPHTTGTK